ncbi:MAG: hypothetical protein J0M09_08765 [Xanthomonadales bacterium]|nr:hypothetical protein [Xanthomonadales bacterium]
MKQFFSKFAVASLLATAAVAAWAGDSSPGSMQQAENADRAIFNRSGTPRSERARWVYRIVAKWGTHVHEAYRTDPRRWADSMAQVFAKASPDALQRAAEARTFSAMNDALLAGTNPVALQPAAASAPSGAVSKRIAARSLGDPAQDLVYVPVTPCRILDTRVAGGSIPANSFRDFDLTDVVRFATQGGDTSNCNVGDKGSFAAAAINFTVVTPSAGGYITAFPFLASQPTAATINYGAGDIRNGLAIVRLDQSAETYEFSVYSFAQTHLVADVVGYFTASQATALECVTLTSQPVALPAPPSGLVVTSPACPSEYLAVSGNCISNTSIWSWQAGSYTTDTTHNCQYIPTAASPVRTVTSAVRCCRTIGR